MCEQALDAMEIVGKVPERVARVIDFWIAFSEVIIIVCRLVCEVWMHHRWEGRPCSRP